MPADRLRALTVGAYLLLLAAAPAGLLAQAPAAACPALAADADAADHVVCWAAFDARNDTACANDACVTAIRSLCGSAALDTPVVGHTCFLANVRAGDFAAALGLVDYLQEPTPLVSKCRQALTSVAQVQLVSNPAGANIEVDGVDYGVAPATVTLKSPWWSRRVRAKFTHATGVEVVELSEQALRAAFDTRSCAMADVVIAGPKTAAVAVPASTKPSAEPPRIVTPAPTTQRPLKPPATEASEGSSAWPWTLTGAVLAASGAVTFRIVGDNQFDDVRASCSPTCSRAQISNSGVETSDALMVGLGITSCVLLVTTVVLAALDAVGESTEPPASASASAPGTLFSGTF